MTRLLGLDVGTTSAKAVVFDEAGRVVGVGRASTPWRTTADGVEMAPADLVVAVLNAMNEAVAADHEGGKRGELIGGVGITSMGESGVLTDGAGAVVAPIVAWHDGRDAREVTQLREQIGEDDFCATTGKPLRGQFSLTKHRWLVHHLSSTSRAVRRFNIAEYLVRVLGGDEACELSLASRTGWLDIAARDWWEPALDFSGASVSLMPALVAAGEPVGSITSDKVNRRLRGAVLTLAGHDHQAAAVGAGAVGLDAELDSCGTAEALVRTVRPTLTRDQVRTLAQRGVTTDWSLQPGYWSLLAATEGGLAMQRVLAMLGVDRPGLLDLDRRAAAAGPGRVTIGGIGSDSLVIHGVTQEADPGQIWKSVVNAATEQAFELHRAMAEEAGPPNELVVTGGWANSEAFMNAKADRFGAYRRSDVQEAGARGAAILAGRAQGLLAPDQSFAKDADQLAQ